MAPLTAATVASFTLIGMMIVRGSRAFGEYPSNFWSNSLFLDITSYSLLLTSAVETMDFLERHGMKGEDHKKSGNNAFHGLHGVSPFVR
jgi:hypothetical protein